MFENNQSKEDVNLHLCGVALVQHILFVSPQGNTAYLHPQCYMNT